MRIAVVSAIEAGSLEAHAINPVKMAAGFVELGHDVLLIVASPRGRRPDERWLNARYALRCPPRWLRIPRRVWGRKTGKHERFAALAMKAVRGFAADMVYARNYALPVLSCEAGIPTAAETHAHIDDPSPPLARLMAAGDRPDLRTLVTISARLADHYVDRGMPREKTLVLADAVDVEQFRPPSPEACDPAPPAAPALPGDPPHALYAGGLYDYKGVPTVIDAAARAPDITYHLIGGPESQARTIAAAARQRHLANLHVHGLLPQSELPPRLWAADLLLMPYAADHPSAKWTSPMKLGEYMAARVPIIASDIPALRDWVDDEHVAFIEPDNAEALAAAARHVLTHRDQARTRVEAAAALAETMTYANRAHAILAHALGAGAAPDS